MSNQHDAFESMSYCKIEEENQNHQPQSYARSIHHFTGLSLSIMLGPLGWRDTEREGRGMT